MRGCQKIANPNGKTIGINSTSSTSYGYLWFAFKALNISGTQCTLNTDHAVGELGFTNDGTMQRKNQDKIAIVKVVGYRKQASIAQDESISSWQGNEVHYEKDGHTVTCWGQVTVTIAPWDYIELSTIPDRFLPDHKTYGPGIANGSNGARLEADPAIKKLRAMALGSAITNSAIIFNFKWSL